MLWVNSFSANQDACLTLSVLDTTASEVGVVLKVQNGFTYWDGLKVVYVPGSSVVRVSTRESSGSWVQQGADLAVTFANGDVLGARARANGMVEVYKNGSLLGTRDMSAWSLYASAGQIGFTVNGGTTTKLDNFGGGTYTGSLSPQTDSAFRTVAYSSPRDSEANTPAIVVTPPANQTWRSYYYLGGKRIAMRTRYGNGNPDVVNYLHGDHLGSTSLTTNASGGLVAQARYYPYGGIRWESGTTPTDYRFTGQRQDANIGLYDYGARFYDPYLNRWIQPDTIVPDPSNPQDLNRYTYARNNPVKYTDPTGHACPGCFRSGNILGLGAAMQWQGATIGPGAVLVLGLLTVNAILESREAIAQLVSDASGSLNPATNSAPGDSGGIQPTSPSPGTNTLISTADPLGSTPATTTLPQPGVSVPASQPLISVGITGGAAVLLAKGEYVPPGLSGKYRNTYRETVEFLKHRVWRVPANYDVPKEVLDEIADMIKQGLSRQDVINNAPALP